MDNDSRALETHRFRLNDLSKEKLDLYQSTLSTFKRDHPEIVGATVFGSHVVGRSKSTSDIDSYIFVEVEKTGLRDDKSSKLSDTKGDKNWETINNSLGEEFRALAKERCGLSDEQAREIRVALISKSRVENDLNSILKYVANSVTANEEGRGNYDDLPMSYIDLLFLMQIGHGLDEYRAQVLRRLKNEGQVGEAFWSTIVTWGVQFGENERLINVDRTSQELFPRSVDSAIQRFGLVDRV